MNENLGKYKTEEKRSEPRTITDKYYSVEFSVKGIDYVYRFKLRDISAKGMCILIKEDSAVLKHLKVNDILKIKYYSTEPLKHTGNLKTEIKHITKYDHGRYKDHYLVGLAIIGDKTEYASLP